MKSTRLGIKPTIIALLVLLPAALFAHDKTADKAKNCGCECCKGKETCCCREGTSATDAAKSDPAKRYPLKGVIIDILVDQSALLVKHEAIPGYMMAMTMVFKVDAATLKAAQKNQPITGTLIQRGEEFWLEDVKPVPAK
jgi:Cu/Ag efflux protein CusF